MRNAGPSIVRSVLAALTAAGLVVGVYLWLRIFDAADLAPWNLPGFVAAFVAGSLVNPAAAVCLTGVLAAWGVTLVLVLAEAPGLGLPRWPFVLALLLTPFPFACPLWFWARQRRLEHRKEEGGDPEVPARRD